MSRKTNNISLVISKLTAAILVFGCVALSSPVILLADTIPTPDASATTTTTTAENSTPPLDVQTVQPDQLVIDSTAVTSATTSTDAVAPTDSTQTTSDLVSTTSPSTDVVTPDTSTATTADATTDTTTPPDSTQTTPDLVSTTSPSTDGVVDTTQQNTDNQNSASDPSASNQVTGTDSQNNSNTDVNNNTDITNTNYAKIFNDSVLAADTGSNNANYNTGSGIITTQKAEGDGELLNVVNKNSVNVAGNGDQTPVIADNSGTGTISDNSSQTNINNELTVKNVNDANVINRVTANINSGNNDANFNTGHGMITTGAANLGLNFFSLANANLVGSQKFYANLQNIYNNYTGNVDLSNELAYGSSPLSGVLVNASNNSTGAGSNNQAIVNVNDQTSITNINKGKLNNEVDAKVVSGQNKANYNTGTGSIVSGGVNSSVNVINFLNSNITSGNWMLKTLNVFGDWKGDLRLPAMSAPNLALTNSSYNVNTQNGATGAGSDNTANTNINDSTNITNNNQNTIENNVTIKTDSGNNEASYNGGSGIVKIGSATAETNEMNVANLNVTGNSWWLVVVNRFGNWGGTAVGSPEAVVVKTTGVSTVLTPAQSGVNVVNSPTGADSNNAAGVNIDHKTDITNSNQADITNTLNVQAISGENEAQRNSGHGYVETGDIRGVNNIVNFANSNITVGNWVVVVVNVFGNWDGNLVFNTPGGGSYLPVGGSLSCPVFNSNGSSISTNVATGAGSDNNSSVANNSNNSATNNNNADLNNSTNASATTGQNNANYNTGNGAVSTGQADTGSSISNQANSNSVNGQSGGGGAASSGNVATGSGSDNSSNTTQNNNNAAVNNNDITANNNSTGSTNTGGNSSNYNTGDGAVDTSWANTFLSQRNQVNDNKITLGDLNTDFNQQPIAPGSQAVVPNDNSSTQVCPGVVIQVGPTPASLVEGGTLAFTAVVKDPYGNIITPQPAFNWTATGGTIDANGLFTAGSAAGVFAVTATASYGNQGSAGVTIIAPVVSGGGGGGGGGGVYYATPKSILGDFNNDGKVDDLDFSILMSSWGLKRTGLLAQEDGDGIVGDPDLSVLMANWTMNIVISQPSGLFI